MTSRLTDRQHGKGGSVYECQEICLPRRISHDANSARDEGMAEPIEEIARGPHSILVRRSDSLARYVS